MGRSCLSCTPSDITNSTSVKFKYVHIYLSVYAVACVCVHAYLREVELQTNCVLKFNSHHRLNIR